MSTFSVQVAQFADKTTKRIDEVVGNVVVEISRRVDMLSPVGDATYWLSPPPAGYIGGHFRANWQLGVDVRPVGEIAGVDPSGSATQGRIFAAVPDEASGHVFWLANNAPYAQRLEDGYSRQAPMGMVGLTATAFPQIVRDVVEGLAA